MTSDPGADRAPLARMPWMPWRILQGRQVPGPGTPRDGAGAAGDDDEEEQPEND